MRKDGKSQYQVKKEKLREIKKILITLIDETEKNDKFEVTMEKEKLLNLTWKKINLIWEIVKDEKDND